MHSEIVITEIDEAESIMNILRHFYEDYPEHGRMFFTDLTAGDLFDRSEFEAPRIEAYLMTFELDLIQVDWNTPLTEQNDAMSEIRRLMQNGQVPEFCFFVVPRYVA